MPPPLPPPPWLLHAAVAAVWLYEGLWSKLLGGDPNQFRIAGEMPFLGPASGRTVLKLLGAGEAALAFWVLWGRWPLACVLVQTVLLVALNANGILWTRRLIHDPAGMVVKNFAFLVLAWVAAGSPWGLP